MQLQRLEAEAAGRRLEGDMNVYLAGKCAANLSFGSNSLIDRGQKFEMDAADLVQQVSGQHL